MKSQTDAILEHLKAGYTITPLEALEKLGCLRLSGRIFEIKAMGYDVRMQLEGNGHKRWARYSLKMPKQIEMF